VEKADAVGWQAIRLLHESVLCGMLIYFRGRGDEGDWKFLQVVGLGKVEGEVMRYFLDSLAWGKGRGWWRMH
jgi:hypothetical protein